MAEMDRKSGQGDRASDRDVLAANPGAAGNDWDDKTAIRTPDPLKQRAPVTADKVVTERGIENLRGEQRMALECLVQGRSVADAAEVTRVSRRTVYRWIKRDLDPAEED